MKNIILLSLVGLAVCFGSPRDTIVDVVPNHGAVGGFGEFVHGDNVKDVVPGPGSDAVVHDVVPGPSAISSHHGFNSAVRDIVPDPGSHSIVRDVVFDPSSNAVIPDVASDLDSNDIVHDVVPGPGVVVQDVVPDSGAVHNVFPGPNAVVYDVVHEPHSTKFVNDAIPDSTSVVHDILPSASAVVHDVVQTPPHFNAFVRDVVPSSKSVVPDILGGRLTTGVGLSERTGISPQLSFSRHAPGVSSGLAAAARPRINPEVLKCGLKPEPYALYQFSRLSYNYPKNEIVQEMERRPSVRAAIFSLDRRGIGSKYHLTPSIYIHGRRSRRQAGSAGECRVQVLTLRQFHAYSGLCWVVNPVYQQVHYHDCGHGCSHQGAGYGTLSRCEATYKSTSVWVYCAGLEYGQRMTKMNVPLPTGCTCRTYNCS